MIASAERFVNPPASRPVVHPPSRMADPPLPEAVQVILRHRIYDGIPAPEALIREARLRMTAGRVGEAADLVRQARELGPLTTDQQQLAEPVDRKLAFLAGIPDTEAGLEAARRVLSLYARYLAAAAEDPEAAAREFERHAAAAQRPELAQLLAEAASQVREWSLHGRLPAPAPVVDATDIANPEDAHHG